MTETLLFGVDGGGTRCRARLCTWSGEAIGEGFAGPANIRFGLEESFAAVMEAVKQCLTTAGLRPQDRARMIGCLALAGASEPENLAAAQQHPHPFRRVVITTDVHAACVGAHHGADGGVVIVGTGTIGWAEMAGRQYRVGGWGFPLSDEGSGAWLGCEALRQVLWAHDGRAAWTPALAEIFNGFRNDPHAIVRFMSRARPGDFARFAPVIVSHASRQDPAAAELMRQGARHVEALLARLSALGVDNLSLVGGLSDAMKLWLAPAIVEGLVSPSGDALAGALQLARKLADSVLRDEASAKPGPKAPA
jgi:glucosamine kinase